MSHIHALRLRRHIFSGELAASMSPRRGIELPGNWYKTISTNYAWMSLKVEQEHETQDGARKFLLRLADDNLVEMVFLPGFRKSSVCISTQVGCAMACKFCASGLEGVVRNLTAHEILEQVVIARQHAPVSNLVLMGSGEPTQNMQAIVAAVQVLRHEAGIGPRHIMLSTVGPPSAIDSLRKLGMKFTLALSLHAVDKELRGQLIPTQANVNPIDLLDAADRFSKHNNRHYQVEVVLLDGVNDSVAQACELAQTLQGRRAHVSLIPWNQVAGMEYAAPTTAAVEQFYYSLKQAGISVALRNSAGGASNAACGQLRAGANLQV